MLSLDSLGMASFLHFIVTMVVCCIISEIKRDIGRKSPCFHTPLHSMGVSVRMLPHCLVQFAILV